MPSTGSSFALWRLDNLFHAVTPLHNPRTAVCLHPVGWARRCLSPRSCGLGAPVRAGSDAGVAADFRSLSSACGLRRRGRGRLPFILIRLLSFFVEAKFTQHQMNHFKLHDSVRFIRSQRCATSSSVSFLNTVLAPEGSPAPRRQLPLPGPGRLRRPCTRWSRGHVALRVASLHRTRRWRPSSVLRHAPDAPRVAATAPHVGGPGPTRGISLPP